MAHSCEIKFKVNENDNEPKKGRRFRGGLKRLKCYRVGTHLPFAVAVLTRPHLSVSETKDISEPKPIGNTGIGHYPYALASRKLSGFYSKKLIH